MAGKFSNTKYNDTVDSVISTMKNAIKNPYYKWSDKPPTSTEYFNINTEQSTLDEGSQLVYSDKGANSPLKYNRIDNMMLYGIENMALQLSSEDFGVESSAIEGEAIILPNTIIPYVGDRFCISYLKNKVIFKVTEVSDDTLEDGANIYKISYRSSTNTYDDIHHHVIDNYTMIVSNIGTKYNPIIKSEVYDLMDKMDSMLVSLKTYYKDIFYSSRVQTFVFKYCENYFYDPYLIEFIRNNKLLDGDDEYIYITHQLPLEPLFPIKYTKTFFYCLENKDMNTEKYRKKAIGKYIDNPNSTFYFRLEDYYEMNYDKEYQSQDIYQPIPCFDEELFNRIRDNKLYHSKFKLYNIIIKYFNDEDITLGDIKELFDLDFEQNYTLFYAIPCIIFCLEKIIKIMIEDRNTSSTYK